MPDLPYLPKISIEEIGLLDCWVKIDGGTALDRRYPMLGKRLIEELLAERHEDQLRLTTAGIELCRSLQHLLATDVEARRIFSLQEQRGGSEDQVP